MKIFYLNINETLKKIPLNELQKYSDGRFYRNVEKYMEHILGMYIVKNIGSKYYNIEDTTVIYEGEKPVFASGGINFSISHSGDIVAAGFCENNIGIDIEKMRERDFEKLAKRYNIPPKKEDFYKFWTNYEAEIKLGKPPVQKFSKIFETDYMLTAVSDTPFRSEIEILKYMPN